MGFIGAGMTAEKCWDKVGLPKEAWMVLYGTLWLFTVVLFALTAADTAFSSMGVAMYIMLAMATAGLRVATRNKLGISGDMLSDVCACCFALPWAIGQMHKEFFPDENQTGKAAEGVVLSPERASLPVVLWRGLCVCPLPVSDVVQLRGDDTHVNSVCRTISLSSEEVLPELSGSSPVCSWLRCFGVDTTLLWWRCSLHLYRFAADWTVALHRPALKK